MRSLVFSLAALAACGSVDSGEISGRATVIDGDTIAVEGTEMRVRLYGIDAPEGQQTCQDANGRRYLCGSRAANQLAGIIGRSGHVHCVEEDRDRYGRIVAECTTPSGTVISAAMVASGWALEYPQYSDGRYGRHQQAAKAAGRGMWAGEFVEPWQWRRGERRRSEPAPQEPVLEARRQSCRAVSTCEEAVRMWCGGYRGADRDRDGIPCENVCRSKQQVDDIRRRTGC